MLLILYAVFMRYFLGNPPGWDIEVSEYILVYVTFLGTAWLLKREGHVSIDFVYTRLNARTRWVLDIVISVIGVIACLSVTYFSGASTLDYIQRNVPTVETLKIPRAVILAILPIGFYFLSMVFLGKTLEHIKGDKTSEGISSIEDIETGEL